MSWDYNRALERVRQRYQQVGEITVDPIVRDTDFDSISLNHPRQVIGAHAYTDITNFRQIVGDGAADADVIRALHIYGREATRIVESDFDTTKVHLQGPKVHTIAYRPVGDDAMKVTAAVLGSAALAQMLQMLSDCLDLDPAGIAAAGVDFGEAIVTKDGVAGDRELLFLGSPANRAAHIVNTGVLLSEAAAELLPPTLAERLTQSGDLWRLSLTETQLDHHAAAQGFTWSSATCRARLAADADTISLDRVKISDAASEIDKTTLSLSNSKAVTGVSLFADVDGFTAYVADAETNGELPEAVRAYHVQRSELRDVLVDDFDGLRIQYQGDRIQGLVYRPIGDDEKVAVKAVRTAAAMMSTTTQVLPQVIGEAAKPLQIGLAYGSVVVSKIGERGNRDVVSVGESTADAARIQQALSGGSIGINRTLREYLPDWMQDLFAWDNGARAYVAVDLTADVLARLEESESSSLGRSLLGVAAATAAGVGSAALLHRAPRTPAGPEPARPPLRPWMP